MPYPDRVVRQSSQTNELIWLGCRKHHLTALRHVSIRGFRYAKRPQRISNKFPLHPKQSDMRKTMQYSGIIELGLQILSSQWKSVKMRLHYADASRCTSFKSFSYSPTSGTRSPKLLSAVAPNSFSLLIPERKSGPAFNVPPPAKLHPNTKFLVQINMSLPKLSSREAEDSIQKAIPLCGNDFKDFSYMHAS